MSLEDWKNVADIIQASVTTIALIVGGVWAYIKFIYRRENVARAEFTIDLDFVGKQSEYWLVEISAFVENKGFTRHQVKNFKINVRYLLNNDTVVDGREDLKFQVKIPHSINKRIEDKERYLYRDTYIDPGLRYRNSYITFIPQNATFVLVFGAFEYGKERFTAQRLFKVPQEEPTTKSPTDRAAQQARPADPPESG